MGDLGYQPLMACLAGVGGLLSLNILEDLPASHKMLGQTQKLVADGF